MQYRVLQNMQLLYWKASWCPLFNSSCCCKPAGFYISRLPSVDWRIHDSTTNVTAVQLVHVPPSGQTIEKASISVAYFPKHMPNMLAVGDPDTGGVGDNIDCTCRRYARKTVLVVDPLNRAICHVISSAWL